MLIVPVLIWFVDSELYLLFTSELLLLLLLLLPPHAVLPITRSQFAKNSHHCLLRLLLDWSQVFGGE